MEDYVQFFPLFWGRMEGRSTEQQLGAKYLPGDTYLIPSTIYRF